jgi:hypothetical protein
MNKSSITIKELYPALTDSQLAEAEDNLERYLALVLRIFERIGMETCSQADPLIFGTGTLGSCTAPGPQSSD